MSTPLPMRAAGWMSTCMALDTSDWIARASICTGARGMHAQGAWDACHVGHGSMTTTHACPRMYVARDAEDGRKLF